jgi:hypothetical protein
LLRADAQANIDRSVDSENAVESDKVITAPVAFSSAPGKTAYLAYITPEEAASLRQAKQGFSSDGNGQEVSDGQYQHLGPKGLMSFNGDRGGGVGGTAGGYGAGDVGAAPGGVGGTGGYGPGDPDSTARSGGRPGGGTPSSDVGVGGGFGPAAAMGRAVDDLARSFARNFTYASRIEAAEKAFAEINQAVRDRGISVTDGRGYSGPAGSPPGPAFGGGDEGNDVGGSQEFPEEEKADTDSTKTTDTDPLSDYIYVPGVGYRRKVRSVKPLSKLKAGGYVTRNGIMARGYSEGGDTGNDGDSDDSDPGPGDGHGGGMSEFVEDLEPEDVEEEKPTDPYEGYTYVKGIGYVPTSRRATSIESASLSSIFTPGFLRTIGIMGDPNEEL